MNHDDYRVHDRAVWERIFADVPDDWYRAPPSDAMERTRAFFAARSCDRILDVGCGVGRWAHDLLEHGAVKAVVGIDYAVNGVRAAAAWARRAGFNGRFAVASALAPPFAPCRFDGLLAALVLDNLSRSDCREAVRRLTLLVAPAAPGLFVFNPVSLPEELADAQRDNPTRDCMHVTYADDELEACLPGWNIDRRSTSAEGFRIVEARRASRPGRSTQRAESVPP